MLELSIMMLPPIAAAFFSPMGRPSEVIVTSSSTSTALDRDRHLQMVFHFLEVCIQLNMCITLNYLSLLLTRTSLLHPSTPKQKTHQCKRIEALAKLNKF
jgi:hypothetical protein